MLGNFDGERTCADCEMEAYEVKPVRRWLNLKFEQLICAIAGHEEWAPTWLRIGPGHDVPGWVCSRCDKTKRIKRSK